MKKREIVIIDDEDELSNIVLGDSEEFEVIREEDTDFDSEKGSVTVICVVQRTSDKKFFELEYYKAGCGIRDFYNNELKEVFKKKKTCTSYE